MKDKMNYMKILILLIILIENIFAQKSNEVKILDAFLEDDQKAYSEIISHPEKYKDVILEKLENYKDKPEQISKSILYIVAFIRDERYIPYLIKIIENKEYSYENCIYSCPIIFSLTIYSCFTNYSLPKLNNEYVLVSDLYSDIERVQNINLISEDVSEYIKGPVIDSELNIGKKLNTETLIHLAGQNDDGTISRTAAAYILKYRLIDINFLTDLYWLAITEIVDASMQFRSSIYWAIYKTEMLRQKGDK